MSKNIPIKVITQNSLAAANVAIPLMIKLKDMFAPEDSVTIEYITNYKRISLFGDKLVIEIGDKKSITVRGKPAFREYVLAQLNDVSGASIK